MMGAQPTLDQFGLCGVCGFHADPTGQTCCPLCPHGGHLRATRVDGRARLNVNQAAELRRKRLRLGITLTDLAEILEIHAVTLSRWETGATRPLPDELEEWRVVLDETERMVTA